MCTALRGIGTLPRVRIMVARCTVDYVGRLTAHLPESTRVIMLKADGSVLIHADGGSYKPLNWMSPPCTTRVTASDDGGTVEVWTVENKAGEQLVISVHEVLHSTEHDLGIDPGLVKDGVEAALQKLLAMHVQVLGEGWSLVRREYPTAIGPVDLLCRDAGGRAVAVEIKRRGEIDGVEQLSRYLELLNRDPLLAPVQGVFAAQEIKPQARVLAEDRGIRCVVLDYEALKGSDDPGLRLF
jgi:RecB family endonuclease NucS